MPHEFPLSSRERYQCCCHSKQWGREMFALGFRPLHPDTRDDDEESRCSRANVPLREKDGEKNQGKKAIAAGSKLRLLHLSFLSHSKLLFSQILKGVLLMTPSITATKAGRNVHALAHLAEIQPFSYSSPFPPAAAAAFMREHYNGSVNTRHKED